MNFPIRENMSMLVMNAVHLCTAVSTIAAAYKKAVKKIREWLRPMKEEKDRMKKSTLVAIIVALAAVVGALVAMCAYLRRREAELDEYEQLLFSEDFSHEQADAEEEAADEPAEEPETAAPGTAEEA